MNWQVCYWMIRFVSTFFSNFLSMGVWDTKVRLTHRLLVAWIHFNILPNRAFWLVVNKPCYWLKWITWFILANSRDCLLQVQLQVKRLYYLSDKFRGLKRWTDTLSQLNYSLLNSLRLTIFTIFFQQVSLIGKTEWHIGCWMLL